VLCCSSAVSAWAAPLAEVEDLIRRGTELRRKGEDATALPLYQRAYELAGGTPRTVAQLGLVETALDYRLEAEAHLTEALSARNEIWINRNRAVLEQTLHGVKAGIGEVLVTGSPTGGRGRRGRSAAGQVAAHSSPASRGRKDEGRAASTGLHRR
jgi:hypothetical protein